MTPLVFMGASKNFAAGQVAPFVTRNDPAGFKPFQLWRKFRFEFGTAWCLAGDTVDFARMFNQTLAELIDRAKIGAHAFEHDLAIDVHHVGVPDPVMVHDRRYFRARAEFARLGSHCENGDLRERQIIENDLRHEFQRTPRMMLQDK